MGDEQTKVIEFEQAKPGLPKKGADLSAAEQQAVADTMFNYLKDVLYNPLSAKLDLDSLPPSFQGLGKGLLYIGQCVVESRSLASDISKGILNTNPLSPGNELASGLKNLQATLKHLTWQMGQVAKGDYKQHVSFAGDFSASVNYMINQLDERDIALRAEMQLNQQKTEELLQSVSLLEAITENINQWIIVVDRETKEWLYSNHDPSKMLHSLSFFDNLRNWLSNQVSFSERENERQLLELSYYEDDDTQYFETTRYPVTWRDRKAFAFDLNDITDDKRAREALETVAYYDALTGSYSRHFGMSILERWIQNRDHFVISFIDMDNLKYVNDTFGHSEGDRYIIDVTDRLKRIYESAVLARLGGDEFMLLSKGVSKDEADARLELMRSGLIDSSSEDYQRSISYGVLEVTAESDKSSSYLLSVADEKMYAYKRARKMERRADLLA